MRDGADGLQVFMVVRHRQIDFASGALVFPGGKVEPEDLALAGGDDDKAARIAAIRETYEECGVLLAPAAARSPIGSRADDRPGARCADAVRALDHAADPAQAL